MQDAAGLAGQPEQGSAAQHQPISLKQLPTITRLANGTGYVTDVNRCVECATVCVLVFVCTQMLIGVRRVHTCVCLRLRVYV